MNSFSTPGHPDSVENPTAVREGAKKGGVGCSLSFSMKPALAGCARAFLTLFMLCQTLF